MTQKSQGPLRPEGTWRTLGGVLMLPREPSGAQRSPWVRFARWMALDTGPSCGPWVTSAGRYGASSGGCHRKINQEPQPCPWRGFSGLRLP
jgi:hypothetical protein